MAAKHGLFIVFKFDKKSGALDTDSRTHDWGRMPPARTYDTDGKARAQWTRYQRAGYGARAAEVKISVADKISIEWCDEGWTLKPQICEWNKRKYNANGGWVGYEKCFRVRYHHGIHWSGDEAKKDPHYDPERALGPLAK